MICVVIYLIFDDTLRHQTTQNYSRVRQGPCVGLDQPELGGSDTPRDGLDHAGRTRGPAVGSGVALKERSGTFDRDVYQIIKPPMAS